MEDRSGFQGKGVFLATPYPPSWIDRFIAWISRLPGPAWAFYVLITLALIVVSHLLRWIDGSVPTGVIEPARVAEVPLLLYALALLHYLNGTARSSMESFRPALALGEAEVARLAYELTTLPRTAGFIAVGVGVVLGVASLMADPASYGIEAETSTLTFVYTGVFSVLSFCFVAGFVIHTIRQLRQVSRIHGMARNIDLFHRVPVYAFSALTARTGIGIIIIMYYYIYLFFAIHLFGPAYRPSPVDLVVTITLLTLAAASFVLPLSGMHHRLAQEKARLSAEADRRFEATLKRLHERLDTDSFEKMDDLNKALASLMIEREALAKLSTWPWRPETLRGFLTSVALPVLLWAVTAFLGRLLEF